jgi:hypothetical protein
MTTLAARLSVRRDKAAEFRGWKSPPAKVVSAGSNRSDGGGNEAVEAFDGKGRIAAPRRCRP